MLFYDNKRNVIYWFNITVCPMLADVLKSK